MAMPIASYSALWSRSVPNAVFLVPPYSYGYPYDFIFRFMVPVNLPDKVFLESLLIWLLLWLHATLCGRGQYPKTVFLGALLLWLLT